MNREELQEQILLLKPNDISQLSDGYHSFEELYTFRKIYNAALFNQLAESYSGYGGAGHNSFNVHKSKYHYDGDLCFGGGWFVVVAMLPTGQITNHYRIEDWNLFKIPETQQALYPWDGHTAQDVVNRIVEFIKIQ